MTKPQLRRERLRTRHSCVVRINRGTEPRRARQYAARHPAAGTQLYLGLPSSHTLGSLAAEVRMAGFEPVPHIAARALTSRDDAHDLLARLNGEAGVP